MEWPEASSYVHFASWSRSLDYSIPPPPPCYNHVTLVTTQDGSHSGAVNAPMFAEVVPPKHRTRLTGLSKVLSLPLLRLWLGSCLSRCLGMTQKVLILWKVRLCVKLRLSPRGFCLWWLFPLDSLVSLTRLCISFSRKIERTREFYSLNFVALLETGNILHSSFDEQLVLKASWYYSITLIKTFWHQSLVQWFLWYCLLSSTFLFL